MPDTYTCRYFIFVSVSFALPPRLLAGTLTPRWLAGGHMSGEGTDESTMKWLGGTGADVPGHE